MKQKTQILILTLACLGMAAIAADELTLSAGWTWAKGNAQRTLVAAVTRFDVAGDAIVQNVQTLTTNVAALVLGGVAAPGFAYYHNLDATNFCEIGRMDGTNFVAFVKLGPTEACMGFFVTNAPYARALATTNSVALDYAVSER